MILASGTFHARPRFHFLLTYEERYDEAEDEYYDVETFHIAVGPRRAACGVEVNDDYAYVMERARYLDSECEECLGVIREHGGSVPPQDPTYGQEAGNRLRSYRDSPPNYRTTAILDSVGFATGNLYLAVGSRSQWDSLSADEQRQVAVSGSGCFTLEYRPDTGRRALFRIQRGTAGEGPVFLLGV